MITTMSIVHASQGELLCITYELFMKNIEEAIQAAMLERQKYVDTGIEIIKQLVENLDFEIEFSQELFRLYVYVQGLLINHKFHEENLQEAKQLMDILHEGYKQVLDKEEIKVPTMTNIETVYAGVTYGKGILNETTVSNMNRGFKA